MSLEFRQLRHVLALAEHGNFARAAVALRLSQPALSRSIQSVERLLGARLFLRMPTGTVPTDNGRLYIERARKIVQMTEALDEQALIDRTYPSGHVSVGGGPYPGQTILSTALARFISAYPRVTARLQIRDWDELLRSLRHREVDFFVAETSTLGRELDLEIKPMPTHPLYFVARSGHALAGRRNVTAADAFDFPLVPLSRIAPRILEPMRAAQRKSPNRLAVSRAFPAAECNSLSVVAHIVRNSDAIMAVTLPCIAFELESRQLVVLGSEPWLFVQYGLVRLKGRPMEAVAEKLIEFVLEAERATSVQEERLIARWINGAAGPRTRRRAATSRRKGRRGGTR